VAEPEGDGERDDSGGQEDGETGGHGRVDVEDVEGDHRTTSSRGFAVGRVAPAFSR
jgi:hypothetical protein